MVSSKENDRNTNNNVNNNAHDKSHNRDKNMDKDHESKDNSAKTMTNAFKAQSGAKESSLSNEKPSAGNEDYSTLIGKLEAELEEIKQKANENWDLALRAKAEVENIRRRTAIDVENAHKYSIERFAKEMLHIVDSLESGIASIDHGENSLKAIHEGLELTYKLLLDSLEKFGIKSVDPIGQNFDPKQHEALTVVESSEAAPNTIVNVIQKGFIQHDRVLRHAKVIVAKAKSG